MLAERQQQAEQIKPNIRARVEISASLQTSKIPVDPSLLAFILSFVYFFLQVTQAVWDFTLAQQIWGVCVCVSQRVCVTWPGTEAPKDGADTDVEQKWTG